VKFYNLLKIQINVVKTKGSNILHALLFTFYRSHAKHRAECDNISIIYVFLETLLVIENFQGQNEALLWHIGHECGRKMMVLDILSRKIP
jgi:hypothetical protein